MTKMRTKAAGAGVAILLGMGGAVAVATSSGAQDTTPVDPVAAEDPIGDELAELDGQDCEWLDGELSEEDLAELRTELEAEADAIIAALDAAGVDYELVPDGELGISFPEPVGDDEAAWEAFEAALVELWAEEFAALPAGEQAEIVEMDAAYAAELRSALDAAGISYELETDPVTGVELPVFDEDDDAAWEALDELGFFEDDLFDDELDGSDDDHELDELDDDADEEPEAA